MFEGIVNGFDYFYFRHSFCSSRLCICFKNLVVRINVFIIKIKSKSQLSFYCFKVNATFYVRQNLALSITCNHDNKS
jgi:hypothetical protein